MFGPKIKIGKGLYARVKQTAELSGYTTVDEFVIHVLEKEIAKADQGDNEEKIKDRLKGLGYIS